MKKFLLYLPMVMLLVSCIQEEPLNAEADIEECVVLNSDLQPDDNVRAAPIIMNKRIIIQANSQIDLKKLALELKITPGATVVPGSKVVRDFSQPQVYRVTSEDERYYKDYIVSIDTFDMPTVYAFEHSDKDKYYTFFEVVQGRDTVFRQYIWASGNSAYSISGQAKRPEDFPTISVARLDETGGRAARLETRTTGSWGAALKMPIAAGNLFIGSFDGTNAVKAPLKSTLFGLPFGKKPVRFEGEYCYKPGIQFVAGVDDKLKPNYISYMDSCDIYAVLYEADGLGSNSLNGDDILTSKNIVALARVKNAEAMEPSDEGLTQPVYKRFEVSFDYGRTDVISWPSFVKRNANNDNGGVLREFDPLKLKQYKYNLAVVFTSSKYGAYFSGALKSTLYIDNVKVICE